MSVTTSDFTKHTNLYSPRQPLSVFDLQYCFDSPTEYRMKTKFSLLGERRIIRNSQSDKTLFSFRGATIPFVSSKKLVNDQGLLVGGVQKKRGSFSNKCLTITDASGQVRVYVEVPKKTIQRGGHAEAWIVRNPDILFNAKRETERRADLLLGGNYLHQDFSVLDAETRQQLGRVSRINDKMVFLGQFEYIVHVPAHVDVAMVLLLGQCMHYLFPEPQAPRPAVP